MDNLELNEEFFKNRKLKSAKKLLPILDDETIANVMELDLDVVKRLRKENNL